MKNVVFKQVISKLIIVVLILMLFAASRTTENCSSGKLEQSNSL